MSVFPGESLKCAVTLELLATMLAQKEVVQEQPRWVLATAQLHLLERMRSGKMSVFPGGLLKCAVTLELLATMLAQKEVLATAQTHEAQEGAGVCP